MKYVIAVAAVAAAIVALVVRPPQAGAGRPAVAGERAAAPRSLPAPAPPARFVVYVAGDVVRPGVYTLPRSSRAVDALRAAGGAKPDADLVAVNLAAPLADGEELAVPVKGAAAPRPHRSAAPGTRSGRPRKRVRAPLPERIDALDLNAAGADELAQLPGLGAALAERIVRFREINGPFAAVDELADVSGMTPGRIDALAPYLTVR